jgi:hypothetical protein
MTIYILRTGRLNFDGVEHSNLVAFTTKREADTVLRARRKADLYNAQYDDVVPLHVYRTRKQWMNGIRQRAKAKKEKK